MRNFMRPISKYLLGINTSKLYKRSLFGASRLLPKSNKQKYSEQRILGYTMDEMFQVVSDIEDYKYFVPWCINSTVTERTLNNIKADLEIGFPPIVEKYTSSVHLIRPHLVQAESTNGKVFKSLINIWKFSPGLTENPKTCTLDFMVSFEFRSIIHTHLSNVFFDQVVRQMVNAFLHQAHRRYGNNSLQSR